MDTENRDLQSLAAMELSGLTIRSIGNDDRFAKLMRIDERIVSRYTFFFASSKYQEDERAISGVRKKQKIRKDYQAFVFAFAYPDQDPGIDQKLISLAGDGVTVIDATGVAMLRECNEKYALAMAYCNLAGGRKNPAAAEYIDRAYEELRPWTERLLSSPVRIYNGEHPEGAVFDTLSHFFDRVLREIFEKYPVSPDTMGLDAFFYRFRSARYRVGDGYYAQINSPWFGVTDPERTPDRLFAFVWGDDSAWYDPRYADEKVVILKKAFDAYLEARLARGEKISFAEIFGALREPPYGLVPNIIGAILMGMFFRTWRHRNLIWTNGFQQDVLDDAHILTMAGNGIHTQSSFYPNVLADYIMLPDRSISALLEAVGELFSLDTGKACFLPDLRSEIRFAMEKLPYPIVSALYADIGEAERETIDRLIRFVRLTSDNGDLEEGEELVRGLCSAFAADDGLGQRIRNCLYGEPLREGFISMLERNGLNGADVTPETLENLCGGHREWKWIWREESILHGLQGPAAGPGAEP